MKVLIITDFYYPHWTGISKSVHYLTQALKSEFVFSVLTVKYDSNLLNEELIDDIKIIRKPYLFRFSRARYSLSLLFEMLTMIAKYDVVLINSPCTNVLPVAIITKIFGKKLLIFHQGDLILPKGTINWLIERVFDVMSFVGFSLADKVASYTDDYLINSRLLPFFKKKSHSVLIPLPFFKDQNNKVKKTGLTKKLTEIKKEKVLIGFAGRFVEEKGFDILLEAINILRRKRDDLHFVFAGATTIDYENFFEKNQLTINEVKKSLTFLGLLNDQELDEFYSVLDLFVIPSRSECFGLVQAEAVSHHVPVVSSNVSGARDVVKKTNFGLFFESENPNDLAITLEQAIGKLAQYQKNYSLIKKYFDYEKAKKQSREFLKG